MWRYLLPFLVVSVLNACGGDVNSLASIKVYKYRGSVQCTGGGTSPAVMSLELTNADISVSSFTCGLDGWPIPLFAVLLMVPSISLRYQGTERKERCRCRSFC